MANEHASRAMNYFRKLGYHVDKCEQYISNPMGKKQSEKFSGGYRRDLFKLFDLIAFKVGCPGVVGVQVTTKKAITSHLSKYRRGEFKEGMSLCRVATDFVLSGNRFLVFGYEKEGRFWVPTIVDVKPQLLEPRVAWKSFVVGVGSQRLSPVPSAVWKQLPFPISERK